MKKDAGRIETDKLLEDMERKIAGVYKEAVKDVEKKLSDYMRQFEKADAEMQEKVKAGKITKREYDSWRQGQVMTGKRWQEMLDKLSKDYHEANLKAREMVGNYTKDVYALNHNYATYDVERRTKIDTSYTMYDKSTVDRLIKNDPDVIPSPTKNRKKIVADKKDIEYQRRQIQSATLQGILQGESIDKIAKRIAKGVGNIDYSSSVRYARTATTSAENAGRMDAYERAQDMGIPVKKVWVATLDDRVRAAHVELDGQEKDIDEPFENEIGQIMYPGDPNADPANVWNCRCTTISQINGFERDVSDLGLRNSSKLGEMSYDDWENKHSNKQEVEKTKEPATISDVNKQAEVLLENMYENHRIRNETRSVPVSDFDNKIRPVNANYGKMSVESAEQFTETLFDLSEKFDTPLTQIRTMTPEEFLAHKDSFAYVAHDYTTDSARLVINQAKCSDIETLSKRIIDLSDRGYCVQVAPDMAGQYVATHEFAHSIINITQPLNDKTNWVNANYDVVRSARKEIAPIYEKYMSDIEKKTAAAKNLEAQAIFATDPKEMQRLGNEARKAYNALSAVKLSEYSLGNVDDFFAEAFTNETIGVSSNPYAKKVMEIVTKYFGGQ